MATWKSSTQDQLILLGIGTLMFLLTFQIISWNERMVLSARAFINDSRKQLVSISPDRIDPANEGKLVYIVGKTSSKPLQDFEFGISAEGFLLRRIEQMYQWDEVCETKTDRRGSQILKSEKSYRQSKVWHEERINSDRFQSPEKHRNPSAFSSIPKTIVAETVSLGAFTLRPDLVRKIIREEILPIAKLPPSLPPSLASSRYTAQKPVIHNGAIYFGGDPLNPQIGDRRILFVIARPQQISLITGQKGNGFLPFRAPGTGEVEILNIGSYSSESLLSQCPDADESESWGLRFLGFILLSIAFPLILTPLTSIIDIFPIYRNSDGLGLSMAIVCSLSLWTLGVIWLFYQIPYARYVFLGTLFLAFVASRMRKAV
ncbi:MAG: TMEM43 family protein [Candidatus Ozemobacteraceae bacterium]